MKVDIECASNHISCFHYMHPIFNLVFHMILLSAHGGCECYTKFFFCSSLVMPGSVNKLQSALF